MHQAGNQQHTNSYHPAFCCLQCVWRDKGTRITEQLQMRNLLLFLFFFKMTPSPSKHTVLWSLATLALCLLYSPATETDWYVLPLPPESYPLILHLLLQYNCSEAIAGIESMELIAVYSSPNYSLGHQKFKYETKYTKENPNPNQTKLKKHWSDLGQGKSWCNLASPFTLVS